MQNNQQGPETTATEFLPELQIDEAECYVEFPPENQEGGQKKTARKDHTGSGSDFHLAIFRQEELLRAKVDLSVPPDLRKRLDRTGENYRLEKMLASGGFGQIFLAHDRVLGRKAVIKSLKRTLLNKDSAVQHFITEAKLCAQLNHPAIVPVYSLTRDSQDGLHIAMPQVPGITLKTYLERSLEYCRTRHISKHGYLRLMKARLSVFLCVCDAVTYCHDRNVIHNDLKPGNIMIGDLNQIHIMDWGAASGNVTINREEELQGTGSYMAPERITSRVSNPLTDIFSLGMILNEMVTLRGPIQETNTGKVLERICTGDFEPSTCILPRYRIDAGLRAIIEKARSPRPADRYQSVRDLADDVRHYLFREEIAAKPDNLATGLGRFFLRHRNISLALLLCVVTGSLFLAGWNYFVRNRTVRDLQHAMYSRLHYQDETEKLAANLRSRVLLLREQLRSLAISLQMESENELPAGDRHVSFYLASDYRRDSGHQPPDLVHTRQYPYPISLDYGSFYLFDSSMKSRDLQFLVDLLRTIRSQSLAAMFAVPFEEKDAVQRDQNRVFNMNRLLISRVIFIYKDKLASCYPGMYGDEKKPEDLMPEFVRRKYRGGLENFWAPPHINRHGQMRISCWQTLYGKLNRKVGLLGFEINYRLLIEPILEQMKKDTDGSMYALVNKEERVIFSSLAYQDMLRDGRVKKPEDMARKDIFYRFPQVIHKIRSGRVSSNFPETFHGHSYQVYWSEIKATDWILIRHVRQEPVELSGLHRQAAKSSPRPIQRNTQQQR